MYLINSFRLSYRCTTLKSVRFLMQDSKLLSSYKSFNSLLTNNKTNSILNVVDNQLRLSSSLTGSPMPISSFHPVKNRLSRKKVFDKDEQLLQNRNVIAFTTADEYDMTKLREGLIKNSPYIPTDIEDFHRSDLLYTEIGSLNSVSERESRQIYFFQEGAVVFWNIPEEECKQILKFVKPYERMSYDPTLIISEEEVMPYSYSQDGHVSDLINGQIVVASNKGNVAAALDRYTFSNAMVLSVKLGVWESILEQYVTAVELLINDLKYGSKIKISREEVLQRTGELFALRHAINLSSDVLDVPDFYWDREELENLYLKMCNYFSIGRRTKVVNAKINHCLELLDLISSNLNDKHHIRLEWMIIILIMVEVIIGFIHLMVGIAH